MLKIIKLDDATISYEDTPEIHKKVFDKLIEFYNKHHAWNGETICQSDDPIIHAPELLADIVDDIIQFKVNWEDA